MSRRAWGILLLDAVLINLSILAVFFARFFVEGSAPPARNLNAYRNMGIFITLVYLILFYFQGLYDEDENADSVSIVFKALSGISLGTVCGLALTYFSQQFAFPRTVFFFTWLFLCAVFIVWRLFLHDRMLRGLPRRRVILFGDEERARSLEEIIRQQTYKRFAYVGHVPGWEFQTLAARLRQGDADAVIVTDNIPSGHEAAFEAFVENPAVAVYLLPNVYDIIAGARFHLLLGDMPLICLSQKVIVGRYRLLKRAMDLFIAVAGLVALSPIFLLLAALIKADSRGPVFYSQDRVGRGGRLFNIFKFRTMFIGAEDGTGPTLAAEEDPRITRAGRILRKFKIDELPQLLNVILGHMSLVGPRPERPVFVEQFERDIPAYGERKKVLPGITGLAQVSGRYVTDTAVKLKFDLIYIYNYNPYLDIVILYNTLQHLLRVNLP